MKHSLSSMMAMCAVMALAMPAHAQSINPALDQQRVETQVSAAITIPLGASSDSRRTAPRFEIIARTSSPETVLPIIARDEANRWQERRIGFTLDGSDSLMINGRPVEMQTDTANLNTGETILVVGGVIVLALAIAFAASIDDIAEASE